MTLPLGFRFDLAIARQLNTGDALNPGKPGFAIG
jgi:hypothetical protein